MLDAQLMLTAYIFKDLTTLIEAEEHEELIAYIPKLDKHINESDTEYFTRTKDRAYKE